MEVGEKKCVWESKGEGGCSHLELLHDTFNGGSAPRMEPPFGFIRRRDRQRSDGYSSKGHLLHTLYKQVHHLLVYRKQRSTSDLSVLSLSQGVEGESGEAQLSVWLEVSHAHFIQTKQICSC